MDHAVDIRMRIENLVQIRLVDHIGLVEGRSLSGDELDSVESNFGRVVEVIHDDDLISMFDESESSEGPDVPRTTVYVRS